MPANYVKAYVKCGKIDANDAAAICEAVTHPDMRFVAIKITEQQAALILDRSHQLLIRQRTMLSNAVRDHLAELKIIAPMGRKELGGDGPRLGLHGSGRQFWQQDKSGPTTAAIGVGKSTRTDAVTVELN